MRVLIVCEMPGSRNALHAVMTSLGWEVVTASRGEEAIEAVEASLHRTSRRLHLLLTDWIMRGMSGWTLMLRARKIVPNLPVVLMTAYANYRIRSLTGKIDHFVVLEKPFSVEVLIQHIKILMHNTSVISPQQSPHFCRMIAPGSNPTASEESQP